MKILKIFGIVAGIHVFALILIFTNPGCSSTSKPAPAPEESAAPPAAPPPVISVPLTSAPVDDGTAAPAPVLPVADAPANGLTLFNPTRPGTLAAAALVQPAVTDVTPASTYVVGRGDSLWSIAKKNHVKVSELVRVNGLRPGSSLHVAQRLIIPGAAAGHGSAASPGEAAAGPSFGAAAAGASAAPAKYVVRRGESLGAIARKFHVRMRDLAVANNISDPQDIHAGLELTIPGGHLAGAKTEAPPAAAPLAADQDLDAGLKPIAPGDVPAVKADDAAPPSVQATQP